MTNAHLNGSQPAPAADKTAQDIAVLEEPPRGDDPHGARPLPDHEDL